MGFSTLDQDLVGWKKIKDSKGNHYIVQLHIEKGTALYATGGNRLNRLIKGECSECFDNKIRAEKVCVVALYEIGRTVRWSERSKLAPEMSDRLQVAHLSRHAPRSVRRTLYRVGKELRPHEFSRSYGPCNGGIHFFASPDRAIMWGV